MSDYWLGVLTIPALMLALSALVTVWFRLAIALRRRGWFMEFGGLGDSYEHQTDRRVLHTWCGLGWGTYQRRDRGCWFAGVGRRSGRHGIRIGHISPRIAPTTSKRDKP